MEEMKIGDIVVGKYVGYKWTKDIRIGRVIRVMKEKGDVFCQIEDHHGFHTVLFDCKLWI